MDAATFATSMGNALPLSRYEALLPAWNRALIQAQCITVNRVAMITAQVGHESGGLRWMQEIASGAAYEGRRDLGNTQKGDGVRFKGHGPIQITGRANHTAVSQWAHQQGYVPSPTYFVDHPEELAGDQFGFLGVVWYWTVARKLLNTYADAGDVLAATKAVNGGTNGLADRQRRYTDALKLGDKLLPTSEDGPCDMVTSQNGYPASADRSSIHTVTVPGTDVRIPVRVGPAGDLLIWAAARWHREVEPLVPGTCWGWAYRAVRGATDLSNHASGTAIDLNAPQHPLGTAPTANFNAAEIAAVRRIIADAQGCLQWGGDYAGRKDPMHIEVIRPEADCARVLATTEDDMTPDQDRRLARVEHALELLVQQVCGAAATIENPFPGADKGGGWENFPGGSPGRRTLVDWCRQNNVDLNDVKRELNR